MLFASIPWPFKYILAEPAPITKSYDRCPHKYLEIKGIFSIGYNVSANTNVFAAKVSPNIISPDVDAAL